MSTFIEKAKQTLAVYTPNISDVAEAEAAIAIIATEAEVNSAILELLSIFERLPEEYSDVVFWSAMHKLEDVPNYEFYLLSSLKSTPSCFGLLMVNRLLNTGQSYIGQTSLLWLLEQISTDSQCSEQIREEALGFFEYQIGKNSERQ